jgi:hypothetical protein
MDPQRLRQKAGNFSVLSYESSWRNFSIPDVVSNVLLFVPFGMYVWLRGNGNRLMPPGRVLYLPEL